MTVLQFVLFLAVAGIAGSIGQALAGYSRGGCLVSIALGFVGALLGSWLARVLGLSEFLLIRIGSESFPLVWSILGATLFVAILGLITRSRPRVRPERR
jgi:uncharacterized membrane protein YeaQ/YmgE (transglycosylase-associated protein family)